MCALLSPTILRLQVRVVKIPGGGIHDSSVVRGMVLKRDAEGTVKRVADGKVAVFAQGIDTAGTETKVRLGCIVDTTTVSSSACSLL